MSFVHVGNMGGQNYNAEVLLADVAVAKDSIIYNASGFADDTTVGNVTQLTLIGVTKNAVDNSGGSAGDKSVQVEMSKAALFEVDTTGTPTQAQMWTDVSLDTVLVADEDDPITTGLTGVVRLRSLLDSANNKVLCNLNYGKNTLS